LVIWWCSGPETGTEAEHKKGHESENQSIKPAFRLSARSAPDGAKYAVKCATPASPSTARYPKSAAQLRHQHGIALEQVTIALPRREKVLVIRHLLPGQRSVVI
jgi:hypothetical protein